MNDLKLPNFDPDAFESFLLSFFDGPITDIRNSCAYNYTKLSIECKNSIFQTRAIQNTSTLTSHKSESDSPYNNFDTHEILYSDITLKHNLARLITLQTIELLIDLRFYQDRHDENLLLLASVSA